MASSSDSNATSPVVWAPKPVSLAVFAIGGSIVGLAILHSLHPIFAFQPVPELPIEPTTEQVQAFEASFTDFYSRNGAIDMAIIGACLGAAFGIGTAVVNRFLCGVLAAIAGAVIGAVSGFATGLYVGSLFASSAPQSLVQSGIFHLAVWGPMAAGIASVIATAQGNVTQGVKAVFAGLIAGLAAVASYIVIASILFSSANLYHIIPETFSERVAWILICSSVLAATLAAGLKPTPNKSVEPTPAP
ncbi:MAG: hypothetical protein KDB22_13440 [Planctomycetales bacterium]|nr:hypothetical protein [Planctomycetales bacterium]